jgi:Putative adhesin Stv domain
MSGLLSSRKEFFEKKNDRRVVISGHGMRIAGEPQITLPLGMTLYFYVLDGELTANSLGRAIEGFTGTGTIPTPVETVAGGSPVWNYRLTLGTDLTINATKLEAKYTLITIDDKDQNRSIPLSILLRDTRCKDAQIHWAACRELKPTTSSMAPIGKFNTLDTLTQMGKNMTDLKAPPVFNTWRLRGADALERATEAAAAEIAARFGDGPFEAPLQAYVIDAVRHWRTANVWRLRPADAAGSSSEDGMSAMGRFQL